MLETDIDKIECIECHGIIVRQAMNGVLGGPKAITFSLELNNIEYTVEINQLGIRTIKIFSSNIAMMRSFWHIFSLLDMLLMIFEGEFIPIEKAATLDILGNEEHIDILSQYVKQRRVGFFASADFTRGSHSTFIDFSNVLTAEMMIKWSELRKELDILHPMVMYSMADTGLPPACKCATIIESFKVLAELIHQRNTSFSLPSGLGKRISKIIEWYGGDIFPAEIKVNKDEFVKILVNSRNRMAHIKSEQERSYLDGLESVLYSVKLSYLYRRILLELLGVDYLLYKDKIITSVTSWDDRNGIQKNFADLKLQG